MGAPVEEAVQELLGSVSSVVESALRSAMSAADAACTYWGQPRSGPLWTSERIAHVAERFVAEIRPRYDDGYHAGIAVAETITWSQLSELVRSPWRIRRARFGDDGERVLEDRWGTEWRTRLDDPVTVRGMQEALSEVRAAVMETEHLHTDRGTGESERSTAGEDVPEGDPGET
ncbi:MAG TPA: hypothetical protein VFZ97_05100 [Acidimicrobiales bacterium]